MEEIFGEKLVARECYLDRVWPFVGSDLVKVFVGLRRSGKSELLELARRRLVAEGQNPGAFICLNFEDYSLRELTDAAKLHAYLGAKLDKIDGRAFVFLDEIQEVAGFEKVVNDFRKRRNVDVFITGSNSSLLSGELATHLAGRYVQFTVYPFSFAEFRAAKAMIGGDGSFEEFLKLGGMPYLATKQLDDNSRNTYLNDIYNSVLLKDIVARWSIRDVGLLERILAFAMQNVGNRLSAMSITKYLKNEGLRVGNQTVLNYLQYFTDSFVLNRVNRFDLVGKEQLSTLAKYYAADHSLRELVVRDGLDQIQGVLENIVALEALRRGYTLNVGNAGSGGGEKEVDFVLRRGKEVRYLQVAYLLADEATAKREFSVLESIPDNYPKTVLSLDPIVRPRSGIDHRKIPEFLLAADW